MQFSKKRLILRAQIENSYDRRNDGDYLRRGEQKQESRAEKVERIARSVIMHDLPADMEEIFGISIRTNVIAVRDGSVILFFQVILAGYNFISDYKGFFESIELIKSQCQRLLASTLRREFRDDFEIGLYTDSPNLPEPSDRLSRRLLDRLLHSKELYPEMPFSFLPKQRTGFFIYLLVFNIVLLAIVAILVYGAVIKTYFP